MALNDSTELIGRTLMMDHSEDGKQSRAQDYEAELESHHEHLKFKCSIHEDEYQEIIVYNDKSAFIEIKLIKL